MVKLGAKIFGKTEGIKPRERTDPVTTRMKTSPGMFLDTQHRAAKAEAELIALRDRSVKIADLRIVDGRKRHLSVQEYAELKANLAAFPLIHPITIRALPAGGFELISGHNRVQAYVDLGRTEIGANVIELADEQVLPAAFYSNLLSPALPDYEKYLGFKQLQQATGKSQSDLAKESGVSKTLISMLFGFDDMSKAAHAIFSAHPHAVSATLVSKLKNLPFADQALAQFVAGEITAQQVLAVAARPSVPQPVVVRHAPVIIKRGKQRFAAITVRDATVIVKLADPSCMPSLLLKIEALIRQEILENSESAIS